LQIRQEKCDHTQTLVIPNKLELGKFVVHFLDPHSLDIGKTSDRLYQPARGPSSPFIKVSGPIDIIAIRPQVKDRIGDVGIEPTNRDPGRHDIN
jgi:hypothetical protein